MLKFSYLKKFAMRRIRPGLSRVCCFMLVLLIVQPTLVAAAGLSTDQKKLYANSIGYLDLCDSSGTSGGAGGTSGGGTTSGGATTGTAGSSPSNLNYIAVGNIPASGKDVTGTTFGGSYTGGAFTPSNNVQGGTQPYDDNGAGNGGGSPAGHAAYAELDNGTALGSLPEHTKLAITYKGKTVIAEKLDVGPNYPPPRDIDLWWETAKLLNMTNGTDTVTLHGVAQSTPTTPVNGQATTGGGSSTSGGSSNSCCPTASSTNASGSGQTIVLDPGHGPDKTTTDAKTGLTMVESSNPGEIDHVWNVANIMKTDLTTAGYNVILTKKSIDDPVTFRDRANTADDNHAALALSIHGDTGLGNPGEIYVQKDGLFRQNVNGSNKTTFNDSAVATKSQQFADIFKTQREKISGSPVVIKDNSFNGRAPVIPGDISLVQLFSKTPWVYNEKHMPFDDNEYAHELEESVKQAVPAGGATGGASSGTGTTGTTGASSSTGASALNVQAATQAAQSAATGGIKVGYAVYDSSGKSIGNNPDGSFENYSASITKSMLLVAYLKQIGGGSLSSDAQSNLTQLIEQSANGSASSPGPAYWVLSRLSGGAADVNAVAQDAGMTGFQIDTSDPLYTLGQSKITADDFAKFFAKIDTMIPTKNRSFALDLLSHITPHVGLLEAGLPGTVYSKEGWKPEGSNWVVNQAGQFKTGGTTYGVAVTVAGVTDEAAGEAIVKDVVKALISSGGGSSSAAACCPSSGGSGGSGGGITGTGTLPSSVPEPYNRIITAAANKFHLSPAFLAAIFYGGENGNSWPNPNGPWADSGVTGGNTPWPGGAHNGAAGPWQFEYPAWQQFKQDGNGDHKKDVENLADATFAAAAFLVDAGAANTTDETKLREAAAVYNGGPGNKSNTHGSYANNVWAAFIKFGGSSSAPGTGGGSTASGAAGTCIAPGTTGDCAAGSAGATVAAAVACAEKLDAAKIPYFYGGAHGALNQDPHKQKPANMDCSGSVSWVLLSAGFKLPGGVTWGGGAPVSGAFSSWGDPGPGQQMTVWENGGHVWIEFNLPGAHMKLDTVNNVGSGPRYVPWTPGSSSENGQMNPRHWPGT